MSIDPDIIHSIERFLLRIKQPSTKDAAKAKGLHQLFNIIIQKISEETQVLFTSTFARLSYIGGAYKINYREMYLLHAFRRWETNKKQGEEDNLHYELGLISIQILLSHWLEKDDLDIEKVKSLYTQISGSHKRQEVTFIRQLKVELQKIDSSHKIITGQLYEEPFSTISINYGISDRNEDYADIMQSIEALHILPVTANLIDLEIYEDGTYAPSSIVLEPDLLYTVTSIADCFGSFTSHEVGYLLKKFTPMPSSSPLIIGNVVNYFLDQLIYTPDLTFEAVQGVIFSLDPMGLANLSDASVREMMSKLKEQFDTIKHVVNTQLEAINISEDSGMVEPSFYSAKYGIYGRLDLFADSEAGCTIVELKSGSPFRPNAYGLSNTHYHQTLLYDMLIESVYGPNVKRNNFILYSKEIEKPLRYAPSLRAQQREAIKARNRLYLHDRNLQHTDNPLEYIRSYYKQHLDQIKGYQKKDIQLFSEVFNQLDTVELAYCNALIQFTINEWLINKVGHKNNNRSNGLAALWTQSLDAKKEQYNILNQLTLLSNQAESDDPILIFKVSHATASISNFRKGDLAVLYPHRQEHDAILYSQVFKVTILIIEEKQITVRLRSRQDNASIFRQHTYWNIEHDSLDNGYIEMTRSTYEWAKAPEAYRALIMGRRPPELTENENTNCGHHLTEEQSQIFSEIIAAKNYYLLWGPPGTGKTSVMLREVAKHFIHHRPERMLLLAYTNRAVDEICQALLSIDPKPSFIRIGSKYSTGEDFLPYLLENKTKGCGSRSQLREVLANEQVYVGTVASILGKLSLFELVKFDIAIVDEASQILEHSLIGLLSRVSKFVLIGDHQQLPAVVQQSNNISAIQDEEMRSLGFDNLNNSLFERLYRSAQANGWDHAYGQLTYQGRMHEDLMAFPSQYFYNNQLKLLPQSERLSASIADYTGKETLAKAVQSNRLAYIPTTTDAESDSIKVNLHEASVCHQLVKSIIEIYKDQNKEFNKNSLGIITPYRAQIAQIRKILMDEKIEIMDCISIDTVERYQGGARDIIIMSTCVNYSFQLESLVSLSSEGIDRKLNVALTRAREQFILVGNPDILQQNELYGKLLEEAKWIKI